jgi:septal ring factor EnvC (AmiA/AmiB activator)
MWLTLSLLLAAVPADGGVPPLATDAGVSEPPRPPRQPSADVEALKKRVTELDARTAELERRLTQVDALSKKLDRTADDLTALKRSVDEREEARRRAEQQAVDRTQQLEAVGRGLVVADQQLATGNTSIEPALRAAEAAYSGPALTYVRAAREALVNGDVASARRLLALALLEAQQAR